MPIMWQTAEPHCDVSSCLDLSRETRSPEYMLNDDDRWEADTAEAPSTFLAYPFGEQDAVPFTLAAARLTLMMLSRCPGVSAGCSIRVMK
ncbi:hypothetical protein M514_17094, partial [Trichuris suis]